VAPTVAVVDRKDDVRNASICPLAKFFKDGAKTLQRIRDSFVVQLIKSKRSQVDTIVALERTTLEEECNSPQELSPPNVVALI
jgi:hypothetical protein